MNEFSKFLTASAPFDERRRARVHAMLARVRAPKWFVGEYGWDESGWPAPFVDSTDPRTPYLSWLREVQAGEIDDDEVEPPVPAGLGMARSSRVNEDLQVIAAGERDLADGWFEPVHRRTAGELLAGARACRRARQLLAAQEVVAAQKARLEMLAFRIEEAWLDVGELIQAKGSSAYDKAVRLLCDLRVLARRRGRVAEFVWRVQALRQEHYKKHTLMARFERAGLTVRG